MQGSRDRMQVITSEVTRDRRCERERERVGPNERSLAILAHEREKVRAMWVCVRVLESVVDMIVWLTPGIEIDPLYTAVP